MGKHKFGRCCLCGTEAVLTRDHAIPRALFVTPKPTNLITVPACGQCNNELKLDEQYFRACVLTGKAYDHPMGRALWDTAVRKDLSTGSGFKALLASQTRKIQLTTQNGEYVQDLAVLEIDRERVERVLRKIVKGLYFHHMSEVLPDVAFIIAIETLDPNKGLKANAEIWRQCAGQTFGNEAVTYRYGVVGEHPSASIWWFLFFKGVFATVITGENSMFEESEQTRPSNPN